MHDAYDDLAPALTLATTAIQDIPQRVIEGRQALVRSLGGVIEARFWSVRRPVRDFDQPLKRDGGERIRERERCTDPERAQGINGGIWSPGQPPSDFDQGRKSAGPQVGTEPKAKWHTDECGPWGKAGEQD
ncbi:hypothetical protein ACFPIJ_24480 [Dactylosporangium cerinum]|uniref:Uncharacterized protein n=1 Tax=Dactylosporangium cerinum TaxID=1434730 RepID=A0ABV9VY12_9ACTN